MQLSAICLKKTKNKFSGRKIVIYSTPRLIKTIVELNQISDIESIARILGMGKICDVKIYGTLPNEFQTTEHTFNTVDLARIIVIPNRIDIRF